MNVSKSSIQILQTWFIKREFFPNGSMGHGAHDPNEFVLLVYSAPKRVKCDFYSFCYRTKHKHLNVRSVNTAELTSIEMYVHSGNMRMVGCVWVGISALVYVRIRINWVWIPEFTHFNRYFRSKRWVLMFVNKVFGNLNIGITYDNLILNRFKIQWFLVL